MACDLNGLEYFLVPKQWAIDIVSTRISNFGIHVFNRDNEEFHTFNERLLMYTSINNLCKASQGFSNRVLS